MPLVGHNIDGYIVSYYSNSPPTIDLKLAGNSVGVLIFEPNGAILPSPAMGGPPANSITLYYHCEDFQNVIDILRNEGPLRIFWSYVSMSNPLTVSGGIVTGNEPVGEGEQ